MGKSSGPQTTVQKTELPEWVQTAAQQNLRIADEIASRPYQAYGGSTVAGFAPEQEQAFQMAQSNLGAYRPALTAAMRVTVSPANCSTEAKDRVR